MAEFPRLFQPPQAVFPGMLSVLHLNNSIEPSFHTYQDFKTLILLSKLEFFSIFGERRRTSLKLPRPLLSCCFGEFVLWQHLQEGVPKYQSPGIQPKHTRWVWTLGQFLNLSLESEWNRLLGKTWKWRLHLHCKEGRVGPKYTGYISIPLAAEASLPDNLGCEGLTDIIRTVEKIRNYLEPEFNNLILKKNNESYTN